MLVSAYRALDPCEVARRLRRAGDDEELGGAEPHDGEIALEAAARIEHRRVHHPACRDVDLVRAQPLQYVQRVATFQHELGERRLVEDDRILAARALLVENVGEPSRRAERVRRPGASRRQEVVGALPVHLAAEHRALRGETIVERRAAQRPDGLELLARPAHRVVQAERLDGAVGEMAAIGVERREPAHVDVPQVERGVALDDPLGDEPARAAGVRDSRRVESCADEESRELRRFAEDEVAVEREALGSVEQKLDLGRLEARRPVDRVAHQDFEMVPVLGQQLEFESFGNRVDVPRLGLRLEPAHHDAADFLLVVEIAVRIAYDGHVGRDAGDRLRDQVEMLGGVERNRDAGKAAECARPLPRAIDERLARDRPFAID